MNLNELAADVAACEGGKQNLSIAQIKEVLKVTARLLYLNPTVLIALLKNGEKQTVGTFNSTR